MAEDIMHPVLIREKAAQWIKGRHGFLNLYKCKCENIFAAQERDVKAGKVKTCGCGKYLKFPNSMTGHPLYSVHKSMLSRCYNKNSHDYKNYGGRGISVCQEWREDRTSFFHWALNSGWKKGLLIDRIDVDGNYEPRNCRFVTQQQSAKNKRKYAFKLSKNDVETMRAMRNDGAKIRDIQIKFNVAYYTVWKAVNGVNHTDEGQV